MQYSVFMQNTAPVSRPPRLRFAASFLVLLICYLLLAATSTEPPIAPSNIIGSGTAEDPWTERAGIPMDIDMEGSPVYVRFFGGSPEWAVWIILQTSVVDPQDYQLSIATDYFSNNPVVTCSVSGTKPLIEFIQCPAAISENGEVFIEIAPLSDVFETIGVMWSYLPDEVGSLYAPIIIPTASMPALGVVNSIIPSWYALPVTSGQNYSLSLSGHAENIILTVDQNSFTTAPGPVCAVEGVGAINCEATATGDLLYILVENYDPYLNDPSLIQYDLYQFFTLELTPIL